MLLEERLTGHLRIGESSKFVLFMAVTANDHAYAFAENLR